MVETPNSRQTRLQSLLDMLADAGELSVVEASEELGVSAATVRRDFAWLDRQQLVTRTHGGVVATSVAYHLPVKYREDGDEAKQRIAEAAADLVTSGDVVGFNGGTTTTATARRVAAREDLTETAARPALTVVTNALNIASEMVLRPHVRTVSAGGVARSQSYELVGPIATGVLNGLWLDHLILGADAASVDGGVCCFHEGEAGVNAVMVERAATVTLVVGSQKLGQRAFAEICGIDAITTVVTDADADPETVGELRDLGVEVLLA